MKPAKILLSVSVVILAVISVFSILSSCRHKKVAIDPGFSEYIVAFTSGTISSASAIRIELAKPLESVELNTEVKEKLFSFSPGIEGKTYWVDNKTVEFKPDKPLKNSQIYDCKFYLNKLFNKIPAKFNVFEFDIETITQEILLKLMVMSLTK